MSDLKSALAESDLFVSYWTGGELTVLFGTRDGVLGAETRPLGNLLELLSAFARCMTDESQYAHFIRAEAPAAKIPLTEIVAQLAAIVVPPSLLRACEAARRLIVLPDASLNVLPIHLLLEIAAGRPFHELFPDGVSYAPSASAYVYACAKRKKERPQRALILIGDDRDDMLQTEAERVRRAVGGAAEIVARRSELSKTEKVDLLYIATHGAAPARIGGGSGGARAVGWELLFDRGTIGPEDFFGERVRLSAGSVVVLSACSVGHLVAGAAHELDGLIQSIFYAGASTILAARWPIIDETADAVFARAVEAISREGVSPALALHDALRGAMNRPDIAAMLTGPDAATFLMGPFALFGSGD